MRKLRLRVLVVLVAAVAGCGGSSGHDHGATGGHADHSEEATPHAHGTVPGEVAAAGQADRKIKVVTKDSLRFDPDNLEVAVGEAVTFVVTNKGSTQHEFVLGDQEYQAAHEVEMAAGEMEHSGNAVTVDPGETKQLTWRFTEPGEVLYGCHVAGHYQGGMVGSISVV